MASYEDQYKNLLNNLRIHRRGSEHRTFHARFNNTCINRKSFPTSFRWYMLSIFLTIPNFTGECQNICGASITFMGNIVKIRGEAQGLRPGKIKERISRSITYCSGILNKFSLRILNYRIMISESRRNRRASISTIYQQRYLNFYIIPLKADSLFRISLRTVFSALKSTV